MVYLFMYSITQISIAVKLERLQKVAYLTVKCSAKLWKVMVTM